MMRIISGEKKGLKLKIPKSNNIRPTADRIKEAVFNIIGDIKDGKVLDLFSGSGSIGIEFLSRGAEFVYFIDDSTISIKCISENLDKINFENKYKVVKQDAIRALKYFEKKDIKFDYIYLDPPYKDKFLFDESIEKIAQYGLLNNNGILIVEHDKYYKIKEYSNLKVVDTRKYGSKNVTFFENIGGK